MGGVQFSTFYFIQELQKQSEIKFELLLPTKGPFSSLCEKNKIPYTLYHAKQMVSTSSSFFDDSLRFPNPINWIQNLLTIFSNSKLIRFIIKDYENSIIITKGMFSHFYSIISARNLSHKMVWHLQDLVSKRYGGVLLKLFNWLADKFPHFIICDGSSIFENLNPLSRSKASIILNGIDVKTVERNLELREKIRSEFKIPSDAYVIGHVGRMTPWKGQLNLLKAFIPFALENKNTFLMLVGSPTFDKDSYENKIIQVICDNALTDQVILTGYRTDLDGMFSAMDFLMYPSLEKDTSPLVLLSAISSGLPVAMSHIESMDEILELIPEIKTFNPLNNTEMTQIIQEFHDGESRKKLGTIIQFKGKHHFGLENHFNKIKSVLLSV